MGFFAYRPIGDVQKGWRSLRMLGMIEHASGLALRFSPGVGAQNVDVRVAELEALEVVKVNPKGALVGSVGQGSEEGLFVTNCSGLPQIRTAVKIWHFLISHLVDQIDDVDNLVDAYVGVGEGVSVLVQQGLHVKKKGRRVTTSLRLRTT